MSRDGLVPTWFTKLTPRRVPARITIPVGVLTAVGAAVIPLSDLAELINIGTLFAFVLVNAGVIYLRRTEPDLDAGSARHSFRCSRSSAVRDLDGRRAHRLRRLQPRACAAARIRWGSTAATTMAATTRASPATRPAEARVRHLSNAGYNEG
jgi:hypothetical protein